MSDAGLPWTYAVGGLAALATAVGVVWKAHVATVKDQLEDLRRALAAEKEAYDRHRERASSMLDACERRADKLEAEYRAHLDEDLRAAGKAGIHHETLADKKMRVSQVLSPEVLAAVKRQLEGT